MGMARMPAESIHSDPDANFGGSSACSFLYRSSCECIGQTLQSPWDFHLNTFDWNRIRGRQARTLFLIKSMTQMIIGCILIYLLTVNPTYQFFTEASTSF